ncbi:hypothetical protein [Rathayibacter soli]|uniref:hypothetical protein n=1 Tax=Rathayibacter soli TaxID=3144168 RepID=UPI0027E3FB01|nr:hypothetical protein [Glaciibacter superstes]
MTLTKASVRSIAATSNAGQQGGAAQRGGRLYAPLLLGAVPAVIGVWALTQVNSADIGDIGVIGALPPAYYAALGLSLIGFVLCVRAGRLHPLLLTEQLIVLIVILNAVDPIVHGLPRLEASYRHLGIAEYIAQYGQVDPKLDAYFDWPGFFGAIGMLADAAGVHDLSALATWAPVGVNLLLLPMLLATARRLTRNPRQAWAGVWVFFIASWVGQDYLSPQAYALLLLFTVLACVLTVLDGWGWAERAVTRGGARGRRVVDKVLNTIRPSATWLDPAPPWRSAHSRGLEYVAITAVCVIVLLAMTVAHQLTPFAAVLFLFGFLLIGRNRMPALVIVAAILPISWLFLGAQPYLAGHFGTVFGSVGDVAAAASASVADRMAGSDAHQFVVLLRLAETGGVWALAVFGAVVARVRRVTWLAAGVGVVAPFVLLPAQPYGGEMLLRVYMFGLPFAACLAVLPFLPKRAGRLGWKSCASLLLLGSLLATATLVTRYGNDSMENFTPKELALVDALYATAPRGSTLIEAVHDTPWRFTHYAAYHYTTVLAARPRPDAGPLNCGHIDSMLAAKGGYLIVTKSQETAARLLGIGPANAVENFVATCGAAPGWSVVAQNGDGIVFHVQGVPRAKG